MLALGMLARGDRFSMARRVSLSIGVVSAVIFAWAWMPIDAQFYNRAAATLFTLLVAGSICRRVSRIPRFSGLWAIAGRRSWQITLALASAALVATISREINQVATGVALGMASFTCLVITGSILAGVAIALSAALGRGAMQDRNSFRTACVYLAEFLLALLILHLRLSRPQWFGGRLAHYWPLIVMAIAFAGVGLGEYFRRSEMKILAEPLHRTGIFLPLLPVLGFWMAHSKVDFSLLLLTVSALYGLMALLRQSFAFGLLSGLAANSALWFGLNRIAGLGFYEHPQVWLIPAALTLLASAQLNRDRLSGDHLRFIRYVALMMVYVSSTADIFLNGVARHPGCRWSWRACQWRACSRE